MKLSLVQTSLTWEDPKLNRDNLTALINSIEDTDLILLPEMFSTGFTMHPEGVAEPMDGDTVQWLKDIATSKDIAITGSLVIEEGDNYYNRLLFITPDGTVSSYDKRHLFTLAGEDKAYTAGKERLIVEYSGWKICPLVCYDLRFPVFSRNTDDYDLLLYVANWPQLRINAWDALLKARAIENMCYVAGVNRVWIDSNGHIYPGHSQVLDALGNCIIHPSSAVGIVSATLDKEELLEIRRKFGFLNDRDSFILPG